MTEQTAEIKKLEGVALGVTDYSNALVVKSEADMEQATDKIRVIKELVTKVKDTFDPIVAAAHATHKEATTARKVHIEPLEAAERTIKGKMGAFLDECERQREAEEKAAREAALKEQEKALKAAKAKVDRLVKKGDNIQQQIVDIKKEMEDPELTDIEEAAFKHRLDILEAQAEGNAEKVAEKAAEAVEPTYTPPVPAPTATPAPKVKGLSSTVKKVGAVTDAIALIKAVADGKTNIPVGVITFDMKVINRLLNAGMCLPGVSVDTDRTMAVR